MHSVDKVGKLGANSDIRMVQAGFLILSVFKVPTQYSLIPILVALYTPKIKCILVRAKYVRCPWELQWERSVH